MHSLSKTIRFPIFAFILFSFLQCTTSLAPKFDELIFQDLSSSSEEVLSFFASVENGVEANSFKDREANYNQLIGKFEALELKTRARPIPANSVLEKVNKAIEIRSGTAITGDYPSAYAMGEVAKTLKMMKKTDAQEGLKVIVIQAFKNQVLIYLDQALTYENFLNR